MPEIRLTSFKVRMLELTAHCLLLLVLASPAVACDGESGDSLVSLVKEIKSYQVQPNCTVKCSMHCQIDVQPNCTTRCSLNCDMEGFSIEQDIPADVGMADRAPCTGSGGQTSTANTTTNTTAVNSNRRRQRPKGGKVFATCQDALNKGSNISGEYTIRPDSQKPFDIYCDMDTDGGGWAVFQRRQDGSEDFYRNWDNYTAGFGNLSGEFWLGLDYINRLTNASSSEMRFDLADFNNETRYAKYNSFDVGDASTKYTMTVSGYSGTATDSFIRHSGRSFSTYDQDNDIWSGSCATRYKGAWWYESCHSSNLNGLYLRGSHSSYGDGVTWVSWKGYYYSFKFTEMKIRPSK